MDFYTRIQNQVTELRSEYNYQNDGTAFGHFIIKECFKKIIDFEFDGTDFDGFIKDHIVDMSNDLGNDAIFINRKNRELLVFQFKYSPSSLLNTSEIKKNKKFIDWIFKLNNEQLKPNYKLEKIIREDIYSTFTDEDIEKKNYRVVFHYIDYNFDKAINTDIKALFNNYNEKNIAFQIKCYNHTELDDLYNDVEIPQNRVELRYVPLECFKKELVFHNGDETPMETIVTTIYANSLKTIIEEHKELILALNVRYYKGENEINARIKEEYSKGMKSNFWILNNGINALCQDFQLDNNKLIINNFQIVNGGQTTNTLLRIVNDLPDRVQMLMRLTAIKNKAKISGISKNIAVASNAQNAITSRDLHSGDRIQTTIFNKLDRVGIFYDKKDGEWATVNKKKYRNPLSKSPLHLKISNIDLGIAYLSFFLQLPISTFGRFKLIFSELYYDQIFSMAVDEDVQFTKLILSYRISEKIKQFRNDNLLKYGVLQNNYVNDVLVSLSAICFFQKNLLKVETIESLKKELSKLNYDTYLNQNEKFSISLDGDFDNHLIKIVNALQYILDVKIESKKDKGEEWLPSDTNNWFKKNETYDEIYEKVIKNLKKLL